MLLQILVAILIVNVEASDLEDEIVLFGVVDLEWEKLSDFLVWAFYCKRVLQDVPFVSCMISERGVGWEFADIRGDL